MIHPNDGPSLLQSVWAQVQTIYYVKQTELVQKNKQNIKKTTKRKSKLNKFKQKNMN